MRTQLGARPLELEREEPRALTGTERVGRADAERRQPRELLRIGLLPVGMKQLEDADRRPPQRQRRRNAPVARQPVGALIGLQRAGTPPGIAT